MYLGDYSSGETVYFKWSTNDSDGASITRATNGTISVYKDDSTTQTTTGVTDTEDFDSITGVHHCSIQTSDAFYTSGTDYSVVLTSSGIDGQTVNAVLAHFSIENRYMRGTNSALLASSAPANFGDLSIETSTGEVTALHMETVDYGDTIYVDLTGGASGTTYPKGTLRDPVDNESDAKTIADANGIKKLKIKNGTYTLSQTYNDFEIRGWVGLGDTSAIVAINNKNIDGCDFKDIRIQGTISSGIISGDNIIISDATTNLRGNFGSVYVSSATLGLGSSVSVREIFFTSCVLDVNDKQFFAGKVNGIVQVNNIDDAWAAFYVTTGGAAITLDSTVVQGSILIFGNHTLIDNKTGGSLTTKIISDFDESADEVDIGAVKGVAVTSTGDFQADLSTINGKLPNNYIMGSSVQTDKDDEINTIKTQIDKFNFVGDDVKATLDSEEVDIGAVKGVAVTSTGDFQADLTALEYDDCIYVDLLSAYSGTSHPVGTVRAPVNNEADARTIADARGIKRFKIRGGTFYLSQQYGNWIFEGWTGTSDTNTTLDFNNQVVNISTLNNIRIQGAITSGYLSGNNVTVVGATTNFAGDFNYLKIAADVTLGTNGIYAQEVLLVLPTINMNDQNFIVNKIGGIGTFTNMTNPANYLIAESGGAKISLDSTITAGTIKIFGNHTIVDDSSPDSDISRIISNVTTVEIGTEVDNSLADIRLDEIIKSVASPATPTKDSFLDLMLNKDASQNFSRNDDSLEALRDRGDAAWITGGGDATAANQNTIITHLTGIKGSSWDGDTDSLESIRDRGDAAWLTGGGDATAANQNTIITHLTGIKGDTWDSGTDSLEALRDRGDAAWITGGDATIEKQNTIITHLTDIKDDNGGADFDSSTDSLEAIRDRGDAAWATAAPGSSTVTITIQNAEGDAVVDASVQIWNEAIDSLETYGTTDNDGQIQKSINSNSYKVKVRKAGYSFNDPFDLTVSGDTSVTYSGSTLTPDPPSSLNLCKVYGYLVDGSDTELEGITVQFVPNATPSINTSTGKAIVPETVAVTSDSDGLFEASLIRNTDFVVIIKAIGLKETIRIPDETLKNVFDLVGAYTSGDQTPTDPGGEADW